MKLGTVIGRVTLSRSVESLKGGRFLVVSPFSREQYATGLDAGAGMGKDPSLVVYDDLGGGVGDVIGYEEGARGRAAVPRSRRRLTPSIARSWTKCFTARGRADL